MSHSTKKTISALVFPILLVGTLFFEIYYWIYAPSTQLQKAPNAFYGILFAAFIITPLFALTFRNANEKYTKLLVWLGIAHFIIACIAISMVGGGVNDKVWSMGSEKANARIVTKRIGQSKDTPHTKYQEEHPTYTEFYVFDISFDVNNKTITVNDIEIDQITYNKYDAGNSIEIEYAIKDPNLVKINKNNPQ